MEQRTLQHTALTVSRACFGTMTLGKPCDPAYSTRLVDACIDHGINFFDTANMYQRAHAPLSEFVRHVYTTPLLFAPQSEFRYQSMGILLAAGVAEKLSGMRLRDFEKQEIFDPLGMKDSSLGLGGRRISDLVSCTLAPSTDPADDERFGPNSLYWRDMGCPWGGMHSTTSDLAILLQTFLDGGQYRGKRVFSPATVKGMTSDQMRKSRRWQLGGAGSCPRLECFRRSGFWKHVRARRSYWHDGMG